jgi:NADH-quinone oxidoreductase subunit G
VKLDVRRGNVVRVLAREDAEVNDAWICDKGRYAFRFADAPGRISTPLVRDHGLERASFTEVFAKIAEWSTGARVAFLAGGRLADEDAYALSKLARTAFRTNDIDHRRQFHGGEAERLEAAAPMRVTYRDVERARAILVVGLDAEQELPILHLRIRKAARRGTKVFVVGPRRTRLHDVAEHILCKPGEETFLLDRMVDGGSDDQTARAADALRSAGTSGVVIAGPELAEHVLAAEVALRLATRFRARFTLVPRRAGDRGALRAGVHPSLLPGGRRVDFDAERAEVESVWGTLDATASGRDTAGILRAAAEREVDVLFLVGVDPLRDFPDAALARRALQNVRHVVVQGLELGELEPYADAFLPAAAFLEREGHFTTWEGRERRLRPVRGPAGASRPDWEILAGLAEAVGAPLGFRDLEDLQVEMAGLLEARDLQIRSDAYTGTGRPAMHEGLSLFSYPLLVDEGRLSEGARELKSALEEPAFLEVHPEDADRLGILDGGRALVRTATGEAELPVRVSDGVAVGSCFVPFDQPGLAANTLLSGRFTASATLQPAADRPEDDRPQDDRPATAQPAAVGGVG